MRRLRERTVGRLRDDSGLALIIVLFVLVIAGLVAGAVVAAAVHSNDTTSRNGKLNAAVAAADAGLDVATYRINMLAPSATNCVTNAVVAPTAGQCPQDGPESIGNGGTFSFWTSPVMAAGAACAGLQIDNSEASIAQRCITSIGTVNGVSARVQERVAAFTATPLFPTALLGLSSVTISNNATIGTQQVPALVGTNGQLTVGGGTTAMTGYELGPGAPAPIVGNGATTGPGGMRTAAQGPFILSPVNPGNSATVNDNSRITNGTDPSSNVTFNAATRVLSMGNNSSLTLGGGTYNFCNFTATNNANLTIDATVKTQIFIDSPDDPNSGCAAGTGNLSLSQNDTVTNNSADPTAVQIYVYGLNNDTNVVNFYNNTNSYISLYAPQSNVIVSPSNNTTFDGAIAAYQVTMGNASHFTFDGEDSSLTAGTTGLYYRTAWEQCPPTPTSSSNPASGC
jgi:Tfp pilus assembly protein PilX